MAAIAAGGVATFTRGQSAMGSMSPIAWTPGEDIEVQDWILAGKRLGTMTRCSQWWLGDWVRYGTSRWGEKYKEASRITGYDIQSLRNISWVAGRVEVSRRRDDLTWSHHAEVSALDPDEQDKWLELASCERMSVSDLRIELRAARRRGEASRSSTVAPLPKPQSTRVKCPECDHEFDVPRTNPSE